MFIINVSALKPYHPRTNKPDGGGIVSGWGICQEGGIHTPLCLCFFGKAQARGEQALTNESSALDYNAGGKLFTRDLVNTDSVEYG